MKEDSIFTKIINGEIPSYKVYEDAKTLAFLNIHPIALGNVLVVPKLQIDKFYELPDEDYNSLMMTVKKVAKRMEEVLNPKRIGLKVVGIDVPHAHIHVIAFDTLDQLQQIEDQSAPVDHVKLANMVKKLAF